MFHCNRGAQQNQPENLFKGLFSSSDSDFCKLRELQNDKFSFYIHLHEGLKGFHKQVFDLNKKWSSSEVQMFDLNNYRAVTNMNGLNE